MNINATLTSFQSEAINESFRLEAVERYFNVAKNRQKDLQDIVSIASYVCEAPISLISLIDGNNVWINASTGVDIEKLPSEDTFCFHTIKQDEIMIINDARNDERFANLDLVLHGPKVRFYVGVPLRSFDGCNVGTLCVADSSPRTLSQLQIDILISLGRQICNLMNTDMNMQLLVNRIKEVTEQKDEIYQTKAELKASLDSSITFHLLLDNELKLLNYNKGAYLAVKGYVGRLLQKGQDVRDLLPEAYRTKFIHNCKKALNGRAVRGERFMDYNNGYAAWWEISYNPAYDENDNIIGITFNALDISKRKEHEEKVKLQHERLMQIAQIQSHEVRSPVTSIIGLMNLIKEDDYATNKDYLKLMETAIYQLDDRIKAIVNYTHENL